MGTIQFIVFKQQGEVCYQGSKFAIEANQLVITGEEAKVSGLHRDHWQNFFCHPGELHSLYSGMTDLIDNKVKISDYKIEPVRMLPLFNGLISVVEKLQNTNNLLMQFMLTYCLGIDNAYFSKLLRSVVTGQYDLIDYFEDNFRQPWSVIQFAKELSIDVHKVNMLFYKNYGISAKQWLLEHRLNYAHQQLINTNKKVVDIALDSGFSNQAHFTESFKKRYQCSPTTLRQTAA